MENTYYLGQRKADLKTLEDILDKTSLENVLEILAEIASEKADHLATNWQDTIGEDIWNKKAAILLNACFAVNDMK